MKKKRYCIEHNGFGSNKIYAVHDREISYLIDIGKDYQTARNVCNALNESEDTIRSLERSLKSILRQVNVKVSIRKPKEVKA